MHWLATVAVAAGVLLLSVLFLLFHFSPAAFSSTPRPSVASERQYASILSSKPQPLPSILNNDDSDDSVRLSVVVPAYNEAKRLPLMLDEALSHLVTTYGNTNAYEIIIVDDGSKDDTAHHALEFARANADRGGKNIRIVKLAKNRGKGGAVRHGVLHARGRRILFVDADGASKFADLRLLVKAMDEMCQAAEGADTSKKASNGHASVAVENHVKAIALGSRAHMVSTDAVVKRSKLRNLLMRSFHLYLSVLGIRSIADTQCGFKLFTRSIARDIFPNLHVEGWIFDIEILIIASLLDGVSIREVPIDWREVDGSKMDLIKDSISMAVDLLVIRASYALGRWSVKRSSASLDSAKLSKTATQ